MSPSNSIPIPKLRNFRGKKISYTISVSNALYPNRLVIYNGVISVCSLLQERFQFSKDLIVSNIWLGLDAPRTHWFLVWLKMLWSSFVSYNTLRIMHGSTQFHEINKCLICGRRWFSQDKYVRERSHFFSD